MTDHSCSVEYQPWKGDEHGSCTFSKQMADTCLLTMLYTKSKKYFFSDTCLKKNRTIMSVRKTGPKAINNTTAHNQACLTDSKKPRTSHQFHPWQLTDVVSSAGSDDRRPTAGSPSAFPGTSWRTRCPGSYSGTAAARPCPPCTDLEGSRGTWCRAELSERRHWWTSYRTDGIGGRGTNGPLQR